MTPTRSSSTTCWPASATAPGSTSSTRGARRRRSSPTSGSACTSAPTSPCPTRSPARSSPPGWSTGRSSSAARPASTSTPRRSRSGRSSAAPPSPASRPRRSASWPTPTPAPTGRSCAGRSASPSTTTPSTTCSRSSTWPCCAATSGAGDRAQPAARARTTSRAAATWAPCRTSCPASRTSRTTRRGRKFEAAWGVTVPPRNGWHLTEMFAAMGRGDLRALYVIGENPAQSEADGHHPTALLEGLDHLVVQDIFLTKTAQLADVVLPGSASWCESNGTVTNSERRVQLVRKALDPPGEARDDVADPARPGPRARPRLGLRHDDEPRTCGTSCAACRRCTPGCRTPASPSTAASSGRATTRTGSSRRTSTAGCGPTTPPTGAAWRRSASSSTSRRSTSSTTSSRCG